MTLGALSLVSSTTMSCAGATDAPAGRIAANHCDAALAQATIVQLASYGRFKRYPYAHDPARVRSSLTPDRAAVFDASLRMMCAPIVPKGQHPDGGHPRLLDYLDEVHGIWGVRHGQKDGRVQFRLSVTWKPGIRNALTMSYNIPPAGHGHVLLPEAGSQRGDDEPGFASFTVVPPRDVATYRQASRQPSFQVSHRKEDETVGEFDIDFDSGTDHLWPPNSDPSSFSGRHSHRHLVELATRHLLSTGFPLSCEDRRHHGYYWYWLPSYYDDPSRCPTSR